ncbi:MAG: LLM class flavin-dependent oxidoreductase [Acidimicrobiia bacterium]|nr:LLM class flavin-dependent oxidoreductase [Acidimicrobiia bacterium]
MRFGLAIPQIFPDGAIDLEAIGACVREADDAGLDSLWVVESGVRSGRAAWSLEPLTLLSYVASMTTLARLGTSVLCSAFRNPVQLATDLASLDQLCAGRLIVGVGSGHPKRGHLFGLSPDHWTERFEEGLTVARKLWAPGTATFQGRFWDFEDLAMEPKPVQRPHPPLWFGARAPRGLRRAARMGSGWMGAGSSSYDEFVEQSRLLSEFLDEVERVDTEFEISKRVYLAIDDGADQESRVMSFFDHVYGNVELGRRCAVWGPPEHCAERIAALFEGGAQMVVINPMSDHRKQLELFRGSVLPLLKR